MNLWRLEWLRLVRTRRLAVLAAVYAFFGLLGPLTARYLPQIIDRFGGGITVIMPPPTPADGVAQFSANTQQIGLLVIAVVAAGALAVDALPEMGIFLRTRVAPARRLLVPRYLVTVAAAAGAFLLGWAALVGGLLGLYSARRGDYRIVYAGSWIGGSRWCSSTGCSTGERVYRPR